MSEKSSYTPGCFALQSDARLDQAAPVQDQWYTVLTTTNAHVLVISAVIATIDETLEIEVVSDGITRIATLAATAGTIYYFHLNSRPDQAINTALLLTAAAITGALVLSMDFCARDLRVRIRKTTAAGAGNLQCKVIYARNA